MRLTTLTALAAAAAVVLATWPAEAQYRNRSGTRIETEAYPGAGYSRARTRITVRRARSYLDPGTEVLPMSRQYTDYAFPPLWYPSKHWDAAGSQRYPLPDSFYLPGYVR